MDITPSQPAENSTGKKHAASAGKTSTKKGRSKATETGETGAMAGAMPSDATLGTMATLEAQLMDDMDGMIATAAYHLAEQRNFEPGHELDDWLEAERRLRK